ncbi:hypothetical protein B0H94_1181 [Salsuginibacillus halophilus]|uniref:Uncharacterized protein n=1 Tax=Salsuginibacillus halophilus TaxID=517424 RepID=A0A2P8H652_9BACI|nr:hypothetical protein [Salsuginibacillus halophilus]PSL41688.1 hypothetical protein B0H94_1181 [Salsuginibacillus halophilus]
MEEKTPFYKKKWFVIPATVILVSGLVNAVSGDDEAEEEEAEEAAAEEETEEAVEEEDEEEQEEAEQEEEEQEEVEETFMTLDEFRDNWNGLINGLEEDGLEHFEISEFDEAPSTDGEGFGYRLSNGLTIMGFTVDGYIEEVYIESEMEAFEQDRFEDVMAYGVLIGATSPDLPEEERGELLNEELGLDEELSFVAETQEAYVNEVRYSLGYFDSHEIVVLRATQE